MKRTKHPLIDLIELDDEFDEPNQNNSKNVIQKFKKTRNSNDTANLLEQVQTIDLDSDSDIEFLDEVRNELNCNCDKQTNKSANLNTKLTSDLVSDNQIKESLNLDLPMTINSSTRVDPTESNSNLKSDSKKTIISLKKSDSEETIIDSQATIINSEELDIQKSDSEDTIVDLPEFDSQKTIINSQELDIQKSDSEDTIINSSIKSTESHLLDTESTSYDSTENYSIIESILESVSEEVSESIEFQFTNGSSEISSKGSSEFTSEFSTKGSSEISSKGSSEFSSKGSSEGSSKESNSNSNQLNELEKNDLKIKKAIDILRSTQTDLQSIESIDKMNSTKLTTQTQPDKVDPNNRLCYMCAGEVPKTNRINIKSYLTKLRNYFNTEIDLENPNSPNQICPNCKKELDLFNVGILGRKKYKSPAIWSTKSAPIKPVLFDYDQKLISTKTNLEFSYNDYIYTLILKAKKMNK